MLAADVPAWLAPPVRRARVAHAKVCALMSAWLATADRAEMSHLIGASVEWLEGKGWTTEEQATFLYSDLWAIEANSSFAGCASLPPSQRPSSA